MFRFILLFLFIYGIYILYKKSTQSNLICSWKCQHCETIFEVTRLAEKLSPERDQNTKFLKCPKCHRFSWARKVKQVNIIKN